MVIDVLRATTTISWALKNGADSIQVFADLDLLKESAIKWQADERLMIGERGGKKIEGFDLGKHQISKYDNLIKRYSEMYGMDWRLMAALCYQESRFTQDIKNKWGANWCTGCWRIVCKSSRRKC